MLKKRDRPRGPGRTGDRDSGAGHCVAAFRSVEEALKSSDIVVSIEALNTPLGQQPPAAVPDRPWRAPQWQRHRVAPTEDVRLGL